MLPTFKKYLDTQYCLIVRSGIDFRFAMSLLTELEESKGPVTYKHFAPSGAGEVQLICFATIENYTQ